jgi:hypothetical protein
MSRRPSSVSAAARASLASLFALASAAGCGSSGFTSKGSSEGGTPGTTGDAEIAESDATTTGTSESGTGADGASSVGAEASLSGPSDAQPPGDVSIPADAQWLGDAEDAPRTFTVVNQCTQTIWAAVLPATTFPGGIVEMPPGYSFQVGVANGWSGRIWGKVQCTTANGHFACASDPFPSSLAELTLTTSATGLDFYDVSLVDGFNLPIEIVAQGHTPNPAHPYDCGDPSCAVNLDETCPQVLQDVVNGTVLACANDACKVLGGNDAASPDCMYPDQYTRFFKSACPTAYSYPSDDPTSTFTCEGMNDYAFVFCP